MIVRMFLYRVANYLQHWDFKLCRLPKLWTESEVAFFKIWIPEAHNDGWDVSKLREEEFDRMTTYFVPDNPWREDQGNLAEASLPRNLRLESSETPLQVRPQAAFLLHLILLHTTNFSSAWSTTLTNQLESMRTCFAPKGRNWYKRNWFSVENLSGIRKQNECSVQKNLPFPWTFPLAYVTIDIKHLGVFSMRSFQKWLWARLFVICVCGL